VRAPNSSVNQFTIMASQDKTLYEKASDAVAAAGETVSEVR